MFVILYLQGHFQQAQSRINIDVGRLPRDESQQNPGLVTIILILSFRAVSCYLLILIFVNFTRKLSCRSSKLFTNISLK